MIPKQVNFFCLKPENVVEIEDIESEGFEDFDIIDIDDMNKSIDRKDDSGNKLHAKLTRNSKSFFDLTNTNLNDDLKIAK